MNKDKILKDIEKLRENYSCSQSTLIALCQDSECGLSFNQLTRLGKGFSGGIGGTFDEGTCGALTGVIMALGLLEDDETKIETISKNAFNKFKEEYGSVKCDHISKNGTDKSPCVECCLYAGEIIIDSL